MRMCGSLLKNGWPIGVRICTRYLDRDNSAHLDENIYTAYWNNTYFFYIGLKKDCPEIFHEIDKIKCTSKDAFLSKLFVDGEFLLAAYLTPYDVCEKIIEDTFKNAGNLFIDIIEGKEKEVLSYLPPIAILSIITHLVIDTYSYESFSEALTNLQLELLTLPNPTDRDYAQLFLINSVLISINKKSAFDSMLTKYGKKIPMILQVGINYCTEENKASSPVIKKFTKQHLKSINRNKSNRELIHELHIKPVDDSKYEEIKKKLEAMDHQVEISGDK